MISGINAGSVVYTADSASISRVRWQFSQIHPVWSRLFKRCSTCPKLINPSAWAWTKISPNVWGCCSERCILRINFVCVEDQSEGIWSVTQAASSGQARIDRNYRAQNLREVDSMSAGGQSRGSDKVWASVLLQTSIFHNDIRPFAPTDRPTGLSAFWSFRGIILPSLLLAQRGGRQFSAPKARRIEPKNVQRVILKSRSVVWL